MGEFRHSAGNNGKGRVNRHLLGGVVEVGLLALVSNVNVKVLHLLWIIFIIA